MEECGREAYGKEKEEKKEKNGLVTVPGELRKERKDEEDEKDKKE